MTSQACNTCALQNVPHQVLPQPDGGWLVALICQRTRILLAQLRLFLKPSCF